MVKGGGERALFPTTLKCVKSQIAAHFISLRFVPRTEQKTDILTNVLGPPVTSAALEQLEE